MSTYAEPGLTGKLTVGSVTEAPRVRAADSTRVAVAPDAWFASEKRTDACGSSAEPSLASTAVTPICDVGLMTETAAGVPGGVGSAGGSSRTVRRTR